MASWHEDWLCIRTFQAGVVGHDQQERGLVAGGGGQVCQHLICLGHPDQCLGYGEESDIFIMLNLEFTNYNNNVREAVVINHKVKLGNISQQGRSDKIKNSQVRGCQNLGTVPKFYLVINYDGFPQRLPWIGGEWVA